ncbi:MAG: hypothetical protein IJP23_01045 [Oscillospiraceae bacterium]|nr:hypothetical protein [Oscillospiraceae bacterium]
MNKRDGRLRALAAKENIAPPREFTLRVEMILSALPQRREGEASPPADKK